MKNGINEVYGFLKACGTYFIATDDNGQPRVRPFGTIDIFNDELTIQTGKVKETSKQIHKNPKIEICAFNGQKWIRVSAEAIEEEAIEAQVHMLDAYPELKGMYQAGDGNNEIFKLTNVKATISGFGIEPVSYHW